MKKEKELLQAKIEYLQDELDGLEKRYFARETYQYLLVELDSCRAQLKRIEVQERFKAIESGIFVRS